MSLLEVLDDGARLAERDTVVGERRDLAVRAARQVLALFEAQQERLAGEPLLLAVGHEAPRPGWPGARRTGSSCPRGRTRTGGTRGCRAGSRGRRAGDWSRRARPPRPRRR